MGYYERFIFFFLKFYFQAFREYHPTKDQPSVLLECVWQTDKYVLVERTNGSETQNQGKDIEEYVPSGTSAVHYHSIEVLLGGNNALWLSLHVHLYFNLMMNQFYL